MHQVVVTFVTLKPSHAFNFWCDINVEWGANRAKSWEIDCTTDDRDRVLEWARRIAGNLKENVYHEEGGWFFFSWIE